MATAVKIASDLVTDAQNHAHAKDRSVAKQIQHWCRIGQMAEANPHLSYNEMKKNMLAEAGAVNLDLSTTEGREQCLIRYS